MPKKPISLCETYRCKNNKSRGKLCGTCSKREWRINNPMKAAYSTLRYNAKRRGKIFEISFEYFEKFAVKTKYIQGKGKTSESFSIDCKIEGLGYVEGNIRVLTLGNNTRKENVRRMKLKYDYHSATAFYEDLRILDRGDVPF